MNNFLCYFGLAYAFLRIAVGLVATRALPIGSFKEAGLRANYVYDSWAFTWFSVRNWPFSSVSTCGRIIWISFLVVEFAYYLLGVAVVFFLLGLLFR